MVPMVPEGESSIHADAVAIQRRRTSIKYMSAYHVPFSEYYHNILHFNSCPADWVVRVRSSEATVAGRPYKSDILH